MRKFNVKVNGNLYQVEVEEVSSFANRIPAVAPAPPLAAPVTAVVEQPTESAPEPAQAAVSASLPEGGVKVTAPMPGVVLRTTSSNGTVVKRGDVILVLEALKMENEIVATASGVLTYAVTSGANVNSGDVLAVIS